MKIDMYSLLGLVKDGKAPKKIKYKDKIYYYHKGYDFNYIYNSSSSSPMDKNNSLFTFSSYKLKDGRRCWDDNTMIDFLNDEVEIPDYEEEKEIPEKLEYEASDENGKFSINGFTFDSEQKIQIIKTVNEIIDFLKSKGE